MKQFIATMYIHSTGYTTTSASVRAISRTLLTICLLLLPLAGHAVAWYGETVNTTDNFYLYHCTTPGFLNSNGSVSNAPEGVCTWKFSKTSYGTIKSSDGKYIYIKATDIGAFAVWTVEINKKPVDISIKNSGDNNKYLFYLYAKKTVGRVVIWEGTHYFGYSGGIKDVESTATEQCKWWLIPESQVKNHVEVSTNEIKFGENTIGQSVSQTFTVKGCNPSEIQIIKSGDDANTPHFTLSTTSIIKPENNATEVTITYDNAYKGNFGCTLTVQIAGNTKPAYNETITVSASTTLREPTFGWNLPEAINAGQTINKIITFPDNYLSLTNLTATLVETGSNDFLEISGEAESGWSITAKEGVEEGSTAYLTLTTTEAGQFAAKTETKSIRITNKSIQTIDWQQDFTDLTTKSSALTLNAVAMSAGVQTGRTITYTITDYSVVNLSGNTLSIVSAGRAKITATVAEDDTYLGASLTKDIFVRDPNAVCSSDTYIPLEDNTSQGWGHYGRELNKTTGALEINVTCAKEISITHDKQAATQQPVDVEEYYDGKYHKLGTFLNEGTNIYTVSYKTTKIRLSVSSNYSHYIRKFTYTTVVPTATPTPSSLTFNTTAGVKATQSISIDWVNTMLHPNITGTNAAQFSVTSGYFGDCLKYGTRELIITYTPSVGNGQEKATLQLLDNSNSVIKEIPLVGNVTKLNQQITTWEVPSTPFKTTDNIDLSTYHIAANSGLKDFTYSIVSGEGTVADIDANGKLTILTGGTLVVRATQAGDATYNPVSADRTITIEKVTPTCVTLPTAKTIIKGQPLSTATLTGAVIRDDKSTTVAGTLAWNYPTATPSSGTYDVIFTPTNTGWYNSLTLQVPVKVLELPTFTCSPATIDFGSAVSVIEGGSSPLTFSKLNNQGQTLTWHHVFSGTNANRFTIDGAISNSGCTVRFNPQDATAHTATLTIWATYTAEGLTVESARQAISLTGTGSIPEAGLNYSLSTCDFGNVYGIKQASQEVGVHFVAVSEISNASFSWKNGNRNNIFRFTYTAGGTYNGTLAITAGVNTPVAATTVYEDVLVVKATKTIGGEEITAELPVKITLHPRQANALALNIVEDRQNGIKAKYNSNGTVAYYYIYIDEIDQLLLKNRNNTTTPISFTLSTKFDTIATLDQDALTLSAVAKARTTHTITISQPQSEEYEAVNIAKFNFRVIKYTPVVTFREGVMEPIVGYETTRRYAWNNTTYNDFIRTTNTETAIEVCCNTASQEGQYMIFDQKGDREWNFRTIKTGYIGIKVTQAETATFDAYTSTFYINIIKDPRHVGVTPIKTLWDNTAAGLHGNTFTENIVNAEWVGDQWVSNAWTGTKWTAGGSSFGSTNAFVIHSGGSVVFHFTGVPLNNNFVYRYANNEPNGGTYTIEESSDGTMWYVLGAYNTHGGRLLNMSGNSRYLRISYQQGDSDKEYVVVWGGGIYERLVARANKNYVTLTQENVGDQFTTAQVTIQTANWGTGGLHVVSNSNPAFSIDLPTVTGNGIDQYKELIATIRYNPEIEDASGIAQIVIKNDTTLTKKVNDSVMIVAQAIAAVTKTIVSQNAAGTGLKTGTVAGPSKNYPYHRGLTNIDLSHCFDAAGQALFDRLYVFGVTNATNGSKITSQYTNSDGSGITAVGVPRINIPTSGTTRDETSIFNATTTCYVYVKGNDGKSYTYSSGESFDATQKRFNMGTSMNGKKLYLTGYCPFACMGTSAGEEGWMYFQGSNDARVDIYMENCEIQGKYKTASGCGAVSDYAENKVELSIGTNFLTGCSSIFVFHSTGGNYTPNIHIMGNNLLIGQMGALMTEVVGKVGPIEVATGIANTGQASAPISILGRKSIGNTNLIMDDNWADGTITNGYLKLSATGQQAPCIDLGSTSGSVTFNGGQYHLRNSAADNAYTCNTVICYRSYVKTAAGQTVTLYGFGNDRPAGCTVTINSGTFTMEKNMQGENFGKDYYRDQETFLDLRLPEQTFINGGTFNNIEYVLACSEATMQGTRPLTSGNEEYGKLYVCLMKGIKTSGTNTDGTAIFTLPKAFNGLPYTSLTPSARGDAATVSNNQLYGGQSINADEFGSVNLMLPGAVPIDGGEEGWCGELKNEKIYQWASSIPKASVGATGTTTISTSGECEVTVGESSNITYYTRQLLYAEVSNDMVGRKFEEGDMQLEFTNSRGYISNTEDYTIDYHLNILMAVEADKWMVFAAPFDITDLTIIEAADEDSVSLLTKANARNAIADANMDFCYRMSNLIVPEITGGRTASHTLSTVATLSINNIKNARTQAGLSAGNRGVYPLDHYDGTNIRSAHYYLYEIDGTDDSFTTDDAGENLNIRWIPVAEKASEARKGSSKLMQKGHVYAIQFPYCPLCNDVDSRTYYDYWTGKLVIFHGYGPQTVKGSNAQNDIKTTTTKPGTARLVGNYTFKDMTLNANNKAYLHDSKTDLFTINTSTATIKPTQGYMLFTAPVNSPQVASFSRAGRVVSYVQDEEVTTDSHVPSIGDRTSMLLYRLDGGFAIDPVRSQQVKLYDMRGQVLFSGYLTEGTRHPFYLSQGLYVLQGEYETLKVLVE